MRAVLQRVTRGAVRVDGETIGSIGQGLVVLLGIRSGDTRGDAEWLARKVATLRIFEDAEGKMNRSLLEVDGEVLLIPQFTLYGDPRKGRRPSFVDAAAPDVAAPLVEQFYDLLVDRGIRRVEKGEFGAYMMVEIHNDGPVTIIVDTDTSHRGNPKG